MELLFKITDFLLLIASIPFHLLKIEPKQSLGTSVVAILSVIFFFLLLPYLYNQIWRLANRRIISALDSKGLIQRTSKELQRNDGSKYLKESLVYPRWHFKRDYIEILPISPVKTEEDLNKELQFFSEIFRTQIIAAKKSFKSKLFFLKYDSLILYKDNLPKMFKYEEIKNDDKFQICLGINNYSKQQYLPVKRQQE